MKKTTTPEFIKKAITTHGDKYDYSLSQYKGWDGSVRILCKVHGEFTQSAGNHLAGKGCSKCANLVRANALRDSATKFIGKATKIHGGKYSYSEVKYRTARIKVDITCKVHGAFSQTPYSHLTGSGCPKCANTLVGQASRLTKSEFVKRATEKHVSKYDYSLVVYSGGMSPVKILCPEHGEFLQNPGVHIRGAGCNQCAGVVKVTNDAFIARANKVHAGRYSYERVDIKNTKTHVEITCPEHGGFSQSASNHLAGNGCPVCGGRLRRTKEQFVTLARKVHGEAYEYDQVEYLNNRAKIKISCLTHGVFLQSPYSHIAGNGCPRCTGNSRYTNESFIIRANEIHKGAYSYDQVDVQGGRVGVTIVCQTHGDFKQNPIDHIQGTGCPKCSKQRAADALKMPVDEFIRRATEIHNGKFIYTDIKYENRRSKIRICCPEHGDFIQSVGNHMTGSGCPACANGGFDQTKPAILYYLRVETRNHLLWKIGITNRSVEERFYGQDSRKIAVLKTWHYALGLDAKAREKDILNEFCRFGYRGRDAILQLGGNTELFTTDVLGLDAGHLR